MSTVVFWYILAGFATLIYQESSKKTVKDMRTAVLASLLWPVYWLRKAVK